MRALLWLLRKYNYVLVFIVLEAFSIVLLSNSNAYQRSVLVNAHREMSGRIFERSTGIKEYFHLRKNNEILVRENAVLRNKLEILSSGINDSLANPLKEREYFYSAAHIVQGTHFKQFNYLTIDKGRSQGIVRDMAVISDEGVVGIVLESSSNFATIIPIINRNFRLSAKIKNNNFVGILQWEGNNHREAVLNEIPYHAELNSGDTIITSGYSAIFPEGLYIGKISSFSREEGNFYTINVELGTNFQRLFHVNVIMNFKQEEQRRLESNLPQ